MKNAFNYSEIESEIKLDFKLREETNDQVFLDFSVENDGKIPANIRDTMWQQGVSSHNGVGRGYGLATVKEFVELMKGTIDVEERDGKVRFHGSIPNLKPEINTAA